MKDLLSNLNHSQWRNREARYNNREGTLSTLTCPPSPVLYTVYVHVCIYVCVCVRERERGREGGREGERGTVHARKWMFWVLLVCCSLHSCVALRDLLVGRQAIEVVDYLAQLWELCLKVRDDVKVNIMHTLVFVSPCTSFYCFFVLPFFASLSPPPSLFLLSPPILIFVLPTFFFCTLNFFSLLSGNRTQSC